MIFQRLAEEALGRLQVALRGEQEVDRVSVLVEGPVQVALLTPDLDVDPMGTGYRLGRLRATISGSATMTQHSHLTTSNGLDDDRTLLAKSQQGSKSRLYFALWLSSEGQ